MLILKCVLKFENTTIITLIFKGHYLTGGGRRMVSDVLNRGVRMPYLY